MIAENYRIKLRDGVELNCRAKETGSSVWIVATHGVGEHLERHNYLPEIFGHNFNVFQYDLRGHGRSGGQPGYVDKFTDYTDDLQEILLYLKEKYKMQRYFLFGHSMGALITAGHLQNNCQKDFYPDRVFLSAPPAAVPAPTGLLFNPMPLSVSKMLANLSFSIKLGGLVDLNNLSHDPRVYEDYIHDELNHLKLHSRLLLQMVAYSKDVFSRPLHPMCPVNCAVGTSDHICSPKALENYFSHIEKGAHFHPIEGGFHELHNEIEKYRGPYLEYLKKCFNESLYKNQL